MDEILRLLSTFLPFLILCLAELCINLKRKERYKQALLPLTAIIFGLAAMILIQILVDRVRTVTEAVVGFLSAVPVLSFLHNLKITWLATILANTAIIAGFIALKLVLFPILRLFNKSKTIAGALSGRWYYYDEHDKETYIKQKASSIRKVILAMLITALVVSSGLLIAVYYINSSEIFNSLFYPAFGVLILIEVYAFLGGEKKESSEEYLPEKERKRREEPDYDPLVKKYENVYPERLLNAAFVSPEHVSESTVSDLIASYHDEYVRTGKPEANIMYHYFGAALLNGEQLDDGMLKQVRALLDQKSVLFNTLFFKDTTPYVFLPLQRQLMRGRKALVILGRDGTESSIAAWIKEGLDESNNIDGLWKVDDFAEDITQDTSVVILQLKDIYNKKYLAKNKQFLEEVSIVFIMEPSRLLGTMQIGLSGVVSMLNKELNPQFVVYDRNCDGLVDSLSHVLNTSIELVNATTVGTARQNYLFWKVDGPNIHHKLGLVNARYLGVGTELATVSIQDGVSAVRWIASEKFPLTDMKWVVSQYYAPLCAAMRLEVSQSELDNHLKFVPDFWSVEKTPDSMMVVEDEYNNAFEIARQFSSRGEHQAFVNVLSSNYLLREYMTDNNRMFIFDPKAIPNFVPDYQRSRANTLFRILMNIINGSMPENEIAELFDNIGIKCDNVYTTLCGMIRDYLSIRHSGNAEEASQVIERILIVDTRNIFDPKTLKVIKKRVYSIRDKDFIEDFLSQLKITYYIAEDEADHDHYLGSILYGHVFQKYLPGVFTVLEGRYYQVVSVTSQNGVVVRRSSDHINSRRYYRQLRKYSVVPLTPKDEEGKEGKEVKEGKEGKDDKEYKEVGVKRKRGSITIEHIRAKIKVETSGYLDMSDYNDIEHAERVTISNIPVRNYENKELLRVSLDNTNPNIRLTIAAMLNELFVTVFPDNHEYICATTHTSNIDGRSDGLIYELDGEDDGFIYFIEDSLIDLGLLINVDRYLIRFLEIICDVLDWHNEKINAAKSIPLPSALSDQEPDDIEEQDGVEEPGDIEGADGIEDSSEDSSSSEEPPKKLTWRERRALRKQQKKAEKERRAEEKRNKRRGLIDDSVDSNGEDSPIDDDLNGENGPIDDDLPNNESPDERPEDSSGELLNKISFEKKRDLRNSSNSVTAKDEIEGSDSESIVVSDEPLENEIKPYSETHYFLYGGSQVPECLHIDETLDFFKEHGFDENYLKQTRLKAVSSKIKYYNYSFEPGVHYCDFCGQEMAGGEYDLLDDGRERCPECTGSAVKTLSQFKSLYKTVKAKMEVSFNIRIKTKVNVRMTNAAEIAKESGAEFVPTSGADRRVLGFARKIGSKRYLYIENGAPQIETVKTLVHELTHMWQYENMMDLFENNKPLEHSEGMAVWAEAQYLYIIGEKERADNYVISRVAGGTEYGRGLELYLKKFPLQTGAVDKSKSPFSYDCDPID